MENSESQSGIGLIPKPAKPEVSMDWRPESIRIASICIIVLGHMLLTTGYIVNDASNPLVWVAGMGIVAFVVCSSYVHALKDDFNKPGSLTLSTYWKFFKNRFLRLYIGYYIALIVIVIAKLCAGYTILFASSGLTIGGSSRAIPIIISPESLALDLSCMWPLITGLLGGLFPEAWFICAIMILSLVYPFLRRLHSINPIYLYLIIAVTLVARLLVVFFSNPNYAFHFPFAWTAEFSVGILIGNRVCKKGGPPPANALYQRILIRVATRVWPIYLFHMAGVVFMHDYAPLKDFILTFVVIIILVEFFVRILRDINNIIGGKKKKK